MIQQDVLYYDIIIDPGGDFHLSFTCYGKDDIPEDLTGAVVTGKLREYPNGSEYLDFICTHNGAGGQVTADMPSESTARINYDLGWYEIKIRFPDSSEEEVMHGKAFCSAPVTRKIVNGTPYTIIAFESYDKFPAFGNLYRLYLDQQYNVLYMWTGNEYYPLNSLKGDAATLDLGTVQTGTPGTNAEITNSGTIHNAVFDFVIPRGHDGDGYCGADYDQPNEGVVMEVSDDKLGSLAFEDDAPADGTKYVRKDGAWVADIIAWGNITGMLSDQTDLRSALDAKVNTADLGDLAYEDDAPRDNKQYARQNGTWEEVAGGGGGSTYWGGITGRLSNQQDLQDALDAKTPSYDLTNEGIVFA